MKLSIVLLTWLACAPALAQISPPGMGDAHSASWLAVAARQDLDARRQSTSYVGVGRVGDGADPAQKPAILVLNEEISDHFREHWMYSAALSYRNQHEYGEHTLHRQEVRVYGRFSSLLRWPRLKLTNTLRPELRTFLTPDFAREQAEPFQLRVRLRSQLQLALTPGWDQRLIASAEVLSALSRTPRGADFGYRESRFCLYYAVQQGPLGIHVGYMNDLIGRRDALVDVHYVALDLTWLNPFGVHHG